MITVTAGELQKKFGRYRDMALKEPVSVTHHGREDMVVLSADEYKRLKRMDTRQTYAMRDLPDDLADALETAEPPVWTAELNHLMEP
jgi:prevent-host-death family protein